MSKVKPATCRAGRSKVKHAFVVNTSADDALTPAFTLDPDDSLQYADFSLFEDLDSEAKPYQVTEIGRVARALMDEVDFFAQRLRAGKSRSSVALDSAGQVSIITPVIHNQVEASKDSEIMDCQYNNLPGFVPDSRDGFSLHSSVTAYSRFSPSIDDTAESKHSAYQRREATSFETHDSGATLISPDGTKTTFSKCLTPSEFTVEYGDDFKLVCDDDCPPLIELRRMERITDEDDDSVTTYDSVDCFAEGVCFNIAGQEECQLFGSHSGLDSDE